MKKRPFTDDEIRIIELLAQGEDQRAIAKRLFMACSTVSYHLHNARKKADARTTAEMIYKLAKTGFL